MKYKEIDELLPRTPDVGVAKLLGSFSSIIDDTVNFGTHLLKWDLEVVRNGEEHFPIATFFRNILELGDAISILVKNSSIDTCQPLLRTLLENTFGLLYMLEENTEERALSYLVWLTHKDLDWCEKFNSLSQHGKQLRKELEKDKYIQNVNLFFDKPEFEFIRKNAEELISSTKFLRIEVEYQRTMTKGKSKNINWFSMFNGPENVEQLGKYLNLHSLYELLYRILSGGIHATNNFKGKLLANQNGGLDIVQIRYPKDAQLTTTNCLDILSIALMAYFKNRVPNRDVEFQKWYLEFRKPRRKLMEDNYLTIIE